MGQNMQIILNQTEHIIGDFEQIFQDLRLCVERKAQNGSEVQLFPELFLCGYPLQDLVLQKEFIERYEENREAFNEWLKKRSPNTERLILVGGLHYEFDEEGLPLYIRNQIFEAKEGAGLCPLYTKILLPNYDIFDEEKYFTPGAEAKIINFAGKNLGLLICEDMWFSSGHDLDPVTILKKEAEKQKISLDLVVNLSASPYFLGKQEKRVIRAKEIASLMNAPLAYVNRVGGEDEILFDGQSFVTDGVKTWLARKFEEDVLSVSLPTPQEITQKATSSEKTENTWESLFRADLSYDQASLDNKALPSLMKWDQNDCKEIADALCFGLQEYALKCGFNKFLVALSGGVDSGLVLTLAKLSLRPGQSLEAIYMPSRFSSPLSTELAEQLCENLEVPLIHFPIKFLHSTMKNEFTNHARSPLEGLPDENIQSRLRGTILYARSNQTGAMVINTSNKSELAVGYSTLYGDSVGAISLLGDIYKSEVYDLAKYLKERDGLLPHDYIERPPSAELRENQEDSQSLPPYERLDAILEGFLSYRLSRKKLQGLGFEEAEVKKVYDLYTKSEYKRNQFCPLIKVKAKSFGFGYRIPITKKN